MANAGLYFCEVDFGSGSLNSSLAQLLVITGEWEGNFCVCVWGRGAGNGGRKKGKESGKNSLCCVIYRCS